MTKYQKKQLAAKNERREIAEYYTVKRVSNIGIALKDTRKIAGHKQQRSQRVKLDRFQHNLTNAQSTAARGEFTYFPGGLFDKPQMFIG